MKFLRTPIFKNICERLLLYFRLLKKKFLKNEKMVNRNLRKMENSDLKMLEKNFRDFRDFRGFRVFGLALGKGVSA